MSKFVLILKLISITILLCKI